VYSFIFVVSIAFYLGEHRQQITAGAFVATVKNLFFILSFDVAVVMVFPSIIRTVFNLFSNSSNSFKTSYSSSKDSIVNKPYELDFIPAEIPIHVAVSILSPVSIHTAIPASRIDSKVERMSS